MALSLGWHIVLACFGVAFPTMIFVVHRRGIVRHRRYDESAVDLMRFIQGAQRYGLRLADIRELVELRCSGECPCEAAATLLRGSWRRSRSRSSN